MKEKLIEMLISAVIKKGILHEARNVDVEIDLPAEMEGPLKGVKIRFKAEHMTITVDK